MQIKKNINLFLSKKIYLFSVLLLILFYLSVNYFTFVVLRKNLNISSVDSYLLDHFLFFLIFLIFLARVLIKKQLKITLKTIYTFAFIFVAYLLFMLFFQSEVLDRYFAKDDYLQLFGYLNSTNGIDESFYNKGGFYYYQFSFFALLFKFFKYNASAYNLFGAFFMAFSAAILFIFLKFLARLHGFYNNLITSSIIFLLGCVYLSSPTIMDMYTFIENSVAFGFIHGFFLLSVLFYIIFLQKPERRIYFFLSFILILFLLKSAYVRTGFLPLILIFLETLYLRFNKNYIVNFFTRVILLGLPFFIRSQVYFIRDSPGRFYSFSIYDFIHFEKIYITFAGLITTFLPYQIWKPIIKTIREVFLGSIDTVSNGYLINNMLFTSGIILCLAISSVLIILNRKRVPIKILTFIFISALVSMAFFMFFGNTGLSKISNSYDIPYIRYGDTPGSRYFLAPFLFFITLFYLLFFITAKGLRGKKVLFVRIVSFILLLQLLSSNIRFTQTLNKVINKDIMIPIRTYTEKVLSIIPDDSQDKLIYSIRVVDPIRTWTYDGFATLYNNKSPKYIDTQKELELYLNENRINRDNFYAFYFDSFSLEFKDESEQYRSKYSEYLLK